MKEVYDFLKKCQVYYLATVEGGQPRVRPFGTLDLYDGRLAFQTANTKPVAAQIKANPKIEISAFDGSQWIRLEAEAYIDDRREARVHMLDAHPQLKDRYQPDDGVTTVFYLKNVTAVISSFTAAPKTIKF
ncbi:pyridoxamine 5'-phosphate oxidase [Spirochaetia bacterium]|nr:pyridoxamine 5'-phosphate oxidase [Spirochaetia bacterium]